MSNNGEQSYFPTYHTEDWQEAVQTSLRGKPLQDLYTATMEGINVQPLYSDWTGPEELPGQFPYTRGVDKNGYRDRPLQCNTVLKGARDPITEWAQAGKIPSDLNTYFENWMEELKMSQPIKDKSVLVNLRPYHEAGADAVQEIACGLAIGSHYILEGQKAGIKPSDLASHTIFSFSIDSSFFMQIAKLRAVRRLWAAVGSAYGEQDGFRMSIHSQTSRRNKTLADPYSNILRASTEAFAAILGGTQLVTVDAFDYLYESSSKLGRRLADNIPLILQHEAKMNATTDPVGGSWYIEELTDQLSEKAWQKFVEIEQNGGMVNQLKTGTIQATIECTAKQRLKDIAERKVSLIGTNIYPTPLAEKALIPDPKNSTADEGERMNFITIKSLTEVRLAQEFEHIRLLNKKAMFKIGLLCLGSIDSYRDKLTFCKNALATVGLEGLTVQQTTTNHVQSFVADHQLSHVFLCGDDSVIAEQIDSAYLNVPVFAVGRDKVDSKIVYIHQETNLIHFIQTHFSFQEGSDE